ncbi:NYN domain-containing protein [Prosthecobacter sp.]|jgi:hypothetical protein|uniref:NYN domain-containing protein n=1 Tax=Prosthecobacter sp. TaxID=1965333 RepID=UPI0037CB71DB
MKNPNSAKLAVLIDADNASYAIISELLAEVSRYGIATVKRAYGDWTTQNLKGWKEVLHKLAIQPIQQFGYTTGKNATDSALIIEAMDLLHTGHLDGFCIVSSDSDFTRLAVRIRESGLVVYGFGAEKTPEAFVAACDKFVYTEILRQTPAASAGDAPAAAASAPELAGSAIPNQTKLKTLLLAAIEASEGEDDWRPLSAVGSMLVKMSPSFDPRNYGVPKLSELIRKQPYLELKKVTDGGNPPMMHLHVRPKPVNSAP